MKNKYYSVMILKNNGRIYTMLNSKTKEFYFPCFLDTEITNEKALSVRASMSLGNIPNKKRVRYLKKKYSVIKNDYNYIFTYQIVDIIGEVGKIYRGKFFWMPEYYIIPELYNEVSREYINNNLDLKDDITPLVRREFGRIYCLSNVDYYKELATFVKYCIANRGKTGCNDSNKCFRAFMNINVNNTYIFNNEDIFKKSIDSLYNYYDTNSDF